MAVDLLDDDIEDDDFQRQGQTDRRAEQDSRHGADDRPDDGYPFGNGRQEADDHGVRYAHGPHAEESQGGNDTAHEDLAADVAAQDVLYFLEEAGQVAAIAFRKDIDEDLDHVAAVFHEVESNDRYDEEFDDRPGNGKDGLDEVGDALDAVIADLDEGIVDDFLDLVRDIELGLLIFKLRHQGRRLADQIVEVGCQQIDLDDQRLDDDIGNNRHDDDEDDKGDEDGKVDGYMTAGQAPQPFDDAIADRHEDERQDQGNDDGPVDGMDREEQRTGQDGQGDAHPELRALIGNHGLPASVQEGIAPPFVADGRNRAVARQDQRIVRQGHEFRFQAVEQRLRRAAVEVGTADRIAEQRIAGKDDAFTVQAEAARRMARRFQDCKVQMAQCQFIAVLDQVVCRRTFDGLAHEQGQVIVRIGNEVGIAGADVDRYVLALAQFLQGADVVGMAMGQEDEFQRQAVAGQCLVDGGIIPGRIDDHGFFRIRVVDDITIGHDGTEFHTDIFHAHKYTSPLKCFLAVQEDGHRPVVCQGYDHMGPETACRHGDAEGADSGDELLI